MLCLIYTFVIVTRIILTNSETENKANIVSFDLYEDRTLYITHYGNKKDLLIDSLGAKLCVKEFCDKLKEDDKAKFNLKFPYDFDEQNKDCIEYASKMVSNNLLSDGDINLTYEEFKLIEASQYIYKRHLDPLNQQTRPDTFKGNNAMLQHIIQSLNNAYLEKSNLTNEILRLPGMSGYKTRHFYNNLCTLQLENRKVQYIEVGSWKGSSSISAMYNNQENVEGTVIDSWALFNPTGAVAKQFKENLNRFKIYNLSIIEADFFTYDLSQLNKKFDIYLYDGPHDEVDHYNAITHMWPHLQNESIIVVDDWNYQDVQSGTYRAFKEINAKIASKFELLETFDGSHTEAGKAVIDFWNGIAVFLLLK